MSQSFTYELSVPGSPSDAQARVQSAVTERMRQAAKMRLAGQDTSSLSFRPQWKACPCWRLCFATSVEKR